jgi:endonuclease/exonuclease/phosphatase family metal-dependent hydrolase
MDNIVDYDRVANVIRSVNPDVVSLQELDSVTIRSNGAYTIQELGKRLNMYYTFGGAIDFEGGKYGIGILSKEKPLSHQIVALPGREEKRALLIVEFPDYFLCSTHFTLTNEDKMASVPIIFEAVKDIKKPLLLGGDMNCGYDSPTQKLLREKFITLSDTIPVGNRRRVIDFIYGYNNGNTYQVNQKMTIEERMASDHFPLFVDVTINQ